jgi:hypothetical protein
MGQLELFFFNKQKTNKHISRHYNSYIAPFARYEYQMDIMGVVELHNESNQARYALAVLDTFSKTGAVEPMNNKDRDSVYQDLLNILNKPKNKLSTGRLQR